MKYFFIALASLVLMPFITFAAEATFGSILGVFGSLISLATPIVVAAALLAFFWGLAKYIWSSGDGKEEGRQVMISGIIGLFVMMSVWGLVQVIRSSFGIGTATFEVPSVTIPYEPGF